MLAWIFTYREEFEERILENLPLFILVGNHWDVNFAEVLREQEDETDGAEEKRKGVKPAAMIKSRHFKDLLRSALRLLCDFYDGGTLFTSETSAPPPQHRRADDEALK